MIIHSLSTMKDVKEQGFPTFQDSYFCESGEQIVIRGNDFTQFKQDVTEAKEFFTPRAEVPKNERTMTYKGPSPQKAANLPAFIEGEPCPRCGAEMVRSPKSGKVFCSQKCWLQKQY